ncbi:hypothetical protein PTKIN_Ptkin14bG0052500 [Pterospermum kingtungense]
MSCLSWNCSGLGNQLAVRALRELVRKEDPMVLFLCETRVISSKLDTTRRSFGFYGCFSVDPRGTGGGVEMLWKEDWVLSLRSYSDMHIDVDVWDAFENQWRLTGVYGRLKTCRRNETWCLLRSLGMTYNGPWVCCGDFNEILFDHEKSGSVARNEAQMEAFRGALDYCGLVDIGFTGPWFTWERGIT